MHNRQDKTHQLNSDSEALEFSPGATQNAGKSVRLPVWTSVWGDRPPPGLWTPDVGLIPGLQAKLEVSQPGDPSEQEADRVAEQVMRMPAQEAPAIPDGSALMGKEHSGAPGTQAAASEVGPVLGSGGGQPLDTATRAFMEPRFGHNFSQVRVHTDGQAAESAEALHARAYTVGNNVVFGAGQYEPGTGEGKRVLAHELTHVVQQSGKQEGEKVASSQPKSIQRQALPEIPHYELSAEPLVSDWHQFGGGMEGMTIDHFVVDHTNIPPRFSRELDHLVSLLNIYREVQVHIEGHTDSTYTREHNQALSVRRAEAVRQALIRRGVMNEGRLIVQGFGEDQLLFPQERTPEERARNRRVEVWFLHPPSNRHGYDAAIPLIPITWSIIGDTPSPRPQPAPTPQGGVPAPREAPESRWRVTMQFVPQIPVRIVGTPTLSSSGCDYFTLPVGVMRNWEGVPAGNRWHFFSQPEFDLDLFPSICRGNWPSLILQDNLVKLTIVDKILEAALVAGASIQEGIPPGNWSVVVQPAVQGAWHPFGRRSVWYREFQVLLNVGLNWTLPFAAPSGMPLPPNTLDLVVGVGVRLELPH